MQETRLPAFTELIILIGISLLLIQYEPIGSIVTIIIIGSIGLLFSNKVKTSFAPGSKVTAEILSRSGLQKYLDQLGFNVVGFGCTTCNGSSGPLDENLANTIEKENLLWCVCKFMHVCIFNLSNRPTIQILQMQLSRIHCFPKFRIKYVFF